MTTNILELFCIIDDFSIQFDRVVAENAIEQGGKKRRNRKSRLSDSEVMTILILFHMSRYRDLKSFYLKYVQVHLKSEFPQTVSHNRFVELQTKVGLKLVLFLNICCLGKCTGVSFIDSYPSEIMPYQTGKEP